jgi:hypothetical protein
MEDLSYHILDIVENSFKALATNIEIAIFENTEADLLKLVIKDDGLGIEGPLVQKAKDPFYTTRTTRRVGMGIPFLEQSARQAEGTCTVNSEKGQGTTITATFKHSHIDRVPLGDISATLITLIAGYPEVNLKYEHVRDKETFTFSTAEVKKALGDVNINDPNVLSQLKTLIQENELE